METTFQTERLNLRLPERRDAKAFAALMGHEDVAPQTGSIWVGYDIRSAEGRIDIGRARWVSGRSFEWVADYQGALIGWFALFQTSQGWELGYAVHPDHWGQGFATEAVNALIHIHQSHNGTAPLRALIHTDNPRSRSVAEKLGFSTYPGLTSSYCLARDTHVPCWTFVHTGAQSLCEAAE
jgi:ribosomal-protein-alanine N-acetyltransferase